MSLSRPIRCPTRSEVCGNNAPSNRCRAIACKKLHLTREEYNRTVGARGDPCPEPWMEAELNR